MQVSVENLSNLERCLNVSFPLKRIDEEFNKRLQNIAPKMTMPGFRPGKVPKAVIIKKFGDSIKDEVLADVIKETYLKALEQEKLNPAAHPTIDVLPSKEGELFSYKAKFEIYPEIKLADFTQLQVEKMVAEVTEEDVNNTLEQLRNENVLWHEITDKTRTAQNGDQLVISFSYNIQGANSPADIKHEKDITMVLGTGKMWTEFEEPLYGSCVGDKREFMLALPETHIDKELAGKKIDFRVDVHKVSEPILPTLDDEFAKKMGIAEGGLAKLKAEVRNTMELELKQALSNLFKKAIMDSLLQANPIDVPKSLVANEVKRMQERWQKQFTEHTHSKKIPAIPPNENFEPMAKRFVTVGLLLSAAIKENNLQVTPEQVRTKVEEQASVYSDSAEVVQWYYAQKERLIEVESLLLEEAALNAIQAVAKITEKPIAYKEVLQKSRT